MNAFSLLPASAIMSFENDTEKNIKESGGTSDSPVSAERPAWDDTPASQGPWTQRFIDSFRRDPNAHVTRASQRTIARGHYDHKAAAEGTANSGLAHKLKARHMQMIAIGGAIGE